MDGEHVRLASVRLEENGEDTQKKQHFINIVSNLRFQKCAPQSRRLMILAQNLQTSAAPLMRAGSNIQMPLVFSVGDWILCAGRTCFLFRRTEGSCQGLSASWLSSELPDRQCHRQRGACATRQSRSVGNQQRPI